MREIAPERLKEAMRRAGMTQSELAAAVGYRQPSIGRLLSGETRTTRAIEEIAARLDTSSAYLCAEADYPGRAFPAEVDIDPDERELLELLREMDERDRVAILQLARSVTRRGGAPTLHERRKSYRPG